MEIITPSLVTLVQQRAEFSDTDSDVTLSNSEPVTPPMMTLNELYNQEHNSVKGMLQKDFRNI